MHHVDMMRYAATQAEMSGSTDRALDYIRLGHRRGRSRRRSDHRRTVARTLRPVPLDALAIVDRHPRTLPRGRASRAGRAERGAGEGARHPRPAVDARGRATTRRSRCVSRRSRSRRRSVSPSSRVTRTTPSGRSLGGIGRMDEGLAELHRARELALETESWADVARAAVNEGGALQTMARDEEALAISLEGAEIARAHGLDRAFGAFLRLNAVESLRTLGRWDEADEQLQEVESVDPLGIDAWRLAEQRCLLAVGRAQFETARAEAARMEQLIGHAGAVARPPRDRARAHRDRGMERRRGRRVASRRSRPCASRSTISGCAPTSASRSSSTGSRPGRRSRRARASPKLAPRTWTHVRELGGQLDDGVATDRWGGGHPGALDALRCHIAAEIARAARSDDGRAGSRSPRCGRATACAHARRTRASARPRRSSATTTATPRRRALAMRTRLRPTSAGSVYATRSQAWRAGRASIWARSPARWPRPPIGTVSRPASSTSSRSWPRVARIARSPTRSSSRRRRRVCTCRTSWPSSG